MSDWISVEDALPSLDGLESWQSSIEVIVCTEHGKVAAARYSINEHARTEKGKLPRFERNGRSTSWRVTHWQPMPDPPKNYVSVGTVGHVDHG